MNPETKERVREKEEGFLEKYYEEGGECRCVPACRVRTPDFADTTAPVFNQKSVSPGSGKALALEM